MALEVAGFDTEVAFCDAKRAKTGTPFFGYTIAETLENTDFTDCVKTWQSRPVF